MKALILAAGVGSRLHPITKTKPKCLVHVNCKPIIEYQIDALLKHDLEKIIIVVGYLGESIKKHVQQRYEHVSNIEFITNADFSTTNNAYSLNLCKELVYDEEFMIMNADVAFSQKIISAIYQSEGSAVSYQKDSYNDESMKVTLENGILKKISKVITQDNANGCSTDLYKFSAADSKKLFDHLHQEISISGVLNNWTEVAIDHLATTGELKMNGVNIGNEPWYEIDNIEDLQNAEVMFIKHQLDLSKYKAAFVDMDGTLYRGNAEIPGADNFIKKLREKVEYVFVLSNNSSKSHSQQVGKLGRFNIAINENEVLLSSDHIVEWLKENKVKKVYSVGTKAFNTFLESNGCMLTSDNPEAVILSYDTELTYEKISTASLLLQDQTVKYFATHPDMVCPTENGPIPDIGSFIKLLEPATQRQPDAIFGKPNPGMVLTKLKELGIEGHECLMFGDRVYTDYKMADAAGMTFIGVTSGESDREDFEGIQNAYVLPSVKYLFDALD